MRQLVERHDQLLHEGIAAHGGRVLTERGEGDSFFAVFARASDAVAAARDLQRALHAEPWAEDVQLRVRMAINTGEAGGDYRGMAANRSARVRGLARGGQVLISQSTHALIRDAVPQGVTVIDLGVQRLRDVASPEHVFEARIEGLPEPPSPAARGVPRRALAVAAAAFAVAALATAAITHLPPGAAQQRPRPGHTPAAAKALSYVISTIAGNGTAGSAPATLATDAELDHPSGVAVTPDGTVYIADTGNNRVLKLIGTTLQTVVGGGSTLSVDQQIGTEVELRHPTGLTTDQDGNLYIADTGDDRVLKLGRDGTVSLVAGTGHPGKAVTGTAVGDAALDTPTSAAFGNVIPDVDTEGRPNVAVKIVEVGNGRISIVYYGEVSPWHDCAFQGAPGIAASFSDWYYTCGNQVFHETGATYSLKDVVLTGTAAAGYSGDNGPYSLGVLDDPQGLALDQASRRLYVADTGNRVIRLVDFDTGRITTVAGSGGELTSPVAVAVAPDGRLYVADAGANVIRLLKPQS
jgi:DNA-binding beta-propeller fold protein YncE